MRFPSALLVLLPLTVAVSACSGGDKKGSDSTSAPEVDTAAPVEGPSGTAVTIAGANFGDEQGTGAVTFGGSAATIQSWSDTSIVATVPTAAFPGSRDITVTTVVDASNTVPFRVILPRALYVNDDIMPASGPNSIEALAVSAAGALTDIPGSPRIQGVNGPGYGGYDGGTLALNEGTRRVLTTGFASMTSWDIDPATGALTSAGTIALGGNYIYGVVVNQAGTRAYVADYDNSRVYGVGIAANGALSALPGSPYDAGATAGTARLSLSVDETRLYSANESSSLGSLHGYDIGVDGSLTELAGSPFDQPDLTYAFARAPDADRFYLGNNDYISAYVPDSAGDLSENVALREFMPGNAFLSFAGTGDRLFALTDATPVPNEADLHVFDVAGSGELVAVAGSPFTLQGFPVRGSIVHANADGTLLLVKDRDQAALHVYTIDGGGLPTEVAGSPFSLEVGSRASGRALTF